MIIIISVTGIAHVSRRGVAKHCISRGGVAKHSIIVCVIHLQTVFLPEFLDELHQRVDICWDLYGEEWSSYIILVVCRSGGVSA